MTLPETVLKEFHDAFGARDAAAVRRLLTDHPDARAVLDAPVFAFDSPAIVAFANDAAMVDVLLDFGADPNRKSSWWAGGFHALYSAQGAAAERLIRGGAVIDACAAAQLDRIDVLRELLATDPTRVHERGGDGQTPLHFARSRDVADLLLEHGADIDAVDVDHRATPAEWMLDRKAGAGRYDLARHLVERGARVDLFLAAALGLTERARAMLQLDPSLFALRTGRGAYGEQGRSSYHIYFWTIGAARSPLAVAAQFGHEATLSAMLELAPPDERLLFAALRGDADAARAVLRANPGVVSALSPSQHRNLPDAAAEGNARAVELLLELGLDPRTPGHDAGTALHWAAYEGSPEVTRALLAHRDAPSLLTIREAHHGGTPLDWCCYGSLHGDRRRDHATVARLLRDAGAEIGAEIKASPAVMAALR